MVKALVLTGFGINCEEETAAAYRLAGAEANIVHFNEVLVNGYSIHDYDILHFPGGFSFGDDLSSGKVMANKIRYKKLATGKTLLDEIKDFINNGKYVMGICNGFQMLVRLGLLPNTNLYFEQQATLAHNDSAKYEDRWVYCKVNTMSETPFLKGIDILPVPVRHGEGKLVFGNDTMRQIVKTKALNCLSYCMEDGSSASEFPYNPNGSELNCAALCDPTGQVFGLMPHPEAFLSLYNHPNWGQIKRKNPNVSEEGAGLKIFQNIVSHIAIQKGVEI
jgi:phosphoribosylformylglycinamidine synthase I